ENAAAPEGPAGRESALGAIKQVDLYPDLPKSFKLLLSIETLRPGFLRAGIYKRVDLAEKKELSHRVRQSISTLPAADNSAAWTKACRSMRRRRTPCATHTY